MDVNRNEPLHPENNPAYSKVEYMINSVCNLTKTFFVLLFNEGMTVQQGHALLSNIKEQLDLALQRALQQSGEDFPDYFNQDEDEGELSDGNPFA